MIDYNNINLLQVGDNVQLKREVVEWYCSNLVWLFGVKQSGEMYGCPHWEFKEEYYAEIRAWLHLYLTNHNPSGYIVDYGAEEDHSKRKNIKVSINLPFIKEPYKIIVKESDVKILSLWR